jgi:hypothetical protein
MPKRLRDDDVEEEVPLFSDSDGEMVTLTVELVGEGFNKTITIQVWAYDTNGSVKTEIKTLEGIPVDRQRLYKGGRLLREDRTVIFNRVVDQDRIRCAVATRHPRGSVSTVPPSSSVAVPMSPSSARATTSASSSDAFKIFAKIAEDRVVTVEINPRMTMSAIRTMIENKEGIDLAGRKVLDENYRLLEDDSTVAAALLVHGSTIVFHPHGCVNCDRLLAMLQAARRG